MISKKFLTNNTAYINPIKIEVEHQIVHSTGSAVGTKEQLFNGWNKPNKLSTHGMVDAIGSFHTMPLNYLANHVGKKGNSKTIGFEICEPESIAYADKAHTRIDTTKYNPKDPANISDFNKRYKNAVEMAVYFCQETGLTADKILSHREACAKGIASNHADVEHWFSLFGKTMDDFRADVKTKLAQKPNPNTGGEQPLKVRVKTDCIAYNEAVKIPKGVYTIVETKGNMGKLKSGAGWINLSAVEKL